MKRNEEYNDDYHRKRPKLDCGPSYAPDSARLITDWDDDLNGDLLEEVCVIAELSQAPRLTQAVKPAPAFEPEDQLAAENRRLRESLKTKEGEVGILRSQLKQTQTAKQNDLLHNRRAYEKQEEKHKSTIESLKKEVDQLQSEIEFKDLEVKGLVEKCKQLQVKSPRINFVQPAYVAVEEKKVLFSLSQAISSKGKSSRIEEEVQVEEKVISRKKTVLIESEGERLKNLLDPSLFHQRDEPSPMTMYASNVSYRESLDHAKSDKYKWIGLPKHTPRLHLLQPIIVDLTKTQTFHQSSLQQVSDVVSHVLRSLIELLLFLNKLPMSVDHDRALLEDTDPGGTWRLQDMLSDKLLRPAEKAVEARRAIGAVCCLALSSPTVLETLVSCRLLSLLLQVVTQIRKLLRPVEFSGVSLAIIFLLQIFLEGEDKTQIDKKSLELSRSILSEIILSRPKLDVLREVVSALAAGAHHSELSSVLCTKSPADTSALYMDSRLQQALFFTQDACPLKLLQVQVTTLAHLCNSTTALSHVLAAFTSWLYSLSSQPDTPQVWLFPDNDQCCNILECFCHLLTLFIPQAERNVRLVPVFERGIVALRDCCKGHKRKLKQTTLKLLPSTLRGSTLLDLLSPRAKEVAFYVMSEYETDATTQDSVHGQSVAGGDS